MIIWLIHSFCIQITKTTSEKSIWTDLKINLNLTTSNYFLLNWNISFYNVLVNRIRCLKVIDLLHLRDNSVFGGYFEITTPPWVRHRRYDTGVNRIKKIVFLNTKNSFFILVFEIKKKSCSWEKLLLVRNHTARG